MKTSSKSLSVNLKDLWKAIKSPGLPNKSCGCIVLVIAENQIVKHDTKSMLKTVKSFYSNLAGHLLAKLPKAPDWYTNNFVSSYYQILPLSENFKLDSTAEGYLFKLLKLLRSQKQQELTKFQETF